MLDLTRTYFNSLSDPDTLTGRPTQTRKIPKTLLTKHPDRSNKIRQPTRQDKDTDHGAIAEDEKGDQKGLETADRRRKGVPGSVPDKITVPENSAWRN